MPAITLGLAEVEERLRALRRRLNAVTAQHCAYLTFSVIIVVLTALIILGLRGSPAAFRAATWSGIGVCLAAGIWGVLATRGRWLDGPATALLADRRGALTDRLVTLVDLRARPRPSRLAPVLVAQLLALSAQWQPQRIAPRRVPRSVFALVLSLLALGSTAFIERRPPAAAGQTGAGATAALTAAGSLRGALSSNDSAAAPPADGPSVPGAQAGDLPRGRDTGDREAGAVPPRPGSQQGTSPAAGQLGENSQAPGGAQGNQQASDQLDKAFSALPDRLQDAIRRAFRAEALDRPRQLAARPRPNDTDPAAAQRDAQRSDQDLQHRDTPDAGKGETKAQSPPKGTDAGAQKGSGKPKSGDQTGQRQDGKPTNQNYDGKSPAAGEGSSPGGLMDDKATAATASSGPPKTFKLTITSFLRAMEQKGNQPRQPGKKTASSGATGGGSATQTALNERQLSDDALRKAEIPPEYEDIVRRVYSLRADQ